MQGEETKEEGDEDRDEQVDAVAAVDEGI